MVGLKIGIAYEGGSDGDIILEITRKVVEPKGYSIPKYEQETPATGLIGFIPLYLKKFEEIGLDLVIFSTDQDNEHDSRRSIIKDKISNFSQTYVDKVALAIPSPHIEAWLFLQDSIIKNLLKLNGAEPLPYSNMPPKQRLMKIFNENQYNGTFGEFKIEIAKRLDLDQCSRVDSAFNAFIQDLRTFLNTRERNNNTQKIPILHL